MLRFDEQVGWRGWDGGWVNGVDARGGVDFDLASPPPSLFPHHSLKRQGDGTCKFIVRREDETELGEPRDPDLEYTVSSAMRRLTMQ